MSPLARIFIPWTAALSVLFLGVLLHGCAPKAQATASPQVSNAASITQPLILKVGSAMPTFSYRLLNARRLTTRELSGHPYMVWVMATWCSSCQGGIDVIKQHISDLQQHNLRIVQLEAAGDLGYAGPPLAAMRTSAGPAALATNWYWGEATASQMQVLDPKGYPDIYYLIDAKGRIRGISGAPAATWSDIATFAKYGRLAQ